MDKLNLQIRDGFLLAGTLKLKWPAVAAGIAGRRIEAGNAVAPPDGLSQEFADGPLRFRVRVIPRPGRFVKQVEITSDEALPTPDYVDVDFQTVDDPELSRRGYMAGGEPPKKDRPEEEGGGMMPGCGYPLIGGKYFVGLEHQAGFNIIEGPGTYRLRHYPVWTGNKLESIDAVFGVGDDPETAFGDYLDEIRLKNQSGPLFAFCSFWSDPYLGNYEYQVHIDNYRTYVKAFHRLGLRPDIYTLDAGWNDRQTFFLPKQDEIGGDPGLALLRREMNEFGSDLSLWISHNGPMGIDPAYLKKIGIAVGGGMSSTYCGEGYGVLMDAEFERLLKERFRFLAGPEIHAVHFKVDWDNDCASNPDFAEKYPTRNHVREASINAMNRIAAAIREVNPGAVIRNGWWPSPWWLCHANHFFLPDSGDSEYAALPAKNQRSSAATHRDIQYYNVLRRDRSMVPLDSFDNHEFPHAMRNPFTEDPATWADTVWHAVMRGSSYLSWKQQPEALEDWQVEAMREIMEFARRYREHIFVRRGYMVLGHPGKGQVYGFVQPGNGSSWCVLRNPLSLPQSVKLENIVFPEAASIIQFYPDFRQYGAGEEIVLLAHEVKLMIFDARARKLPFAMPFQVGGSYEYRFPASLTVDDRVRPMVDAIYQIPALECSGQSVETTGGIQHFRFKVRAPYRLRNFELQFRLPDPARKLRIRLYSSRYEATSRTSSYAMPLTEIPYSSPGHGEKKNPDGFPDQSMRYFSVNAPQGGEAYYSLEIEGGEIGPAELELWAAGYEAPSREAIVLKEGPEGFEKGLPYPHPLGFPLSAQCKFG